LIYERAEVLHALWVETHGLSQELGVEAINAEHDHSLVGLIGQLSCASRRSDSSVRICDALRYSADEEEAQHR
jgi:hypothetical protein